MNFHIITLFPNSFESYINESILKRAQERKKIDIKFYNPRDFTRDKHRRVDDKPYGGGPGMVMMAEPIIEAVEKAKILSMKGNGNKKPKIIILSPSGKQFDNIYARKLAKNYKDVIIISGHYEGIDARVKKILRPEEISIGPYILTGGELPAMIIVDTVSRQIEGVLGDLNSLEENRVSISEVYTRPEKVVYKNKKYSVPKILLSGDHKKIEEWKKNKIKDI